jgi:hypothetical protein
MKIRLWHLAVAGLFAATTYSSSAATASTNEPTITLELRDGSRVVGKDGTDHFKFRSEILGDIKLSPDQLASVEFLPNTNWAKLLVANGDVLSAEVVTEKIQLETSFGKISVPVTSLRRLSIAGASAGRPTEGLVAFWSAANRGKSTVGDSRAVPMGPQAFGNGDGEAGFWFGNGGFLLVHADDSLNVGKGDGFTFETWINPQTVGSEMILFEYERNLGSNSGSDVGMELAIHRATTEGEGIGCLYANIKDANDGSHFFTSPPNLLNPGRWQHVALTYDKNTGTAAIYLNGTVIAHENLGTFTPSTSFQNLLLGARTFNAGFGGSLFLGRLDDFGVYSRALSAAEIKSIYVDENRDRH